MKPEFLLCPVTELFLRSRIKNFGNNAELARRTGITRAQISRIADGKDLPKWCTLLPLLRELGVQFAAPIEPRSAENPTRPAK